jgi:hypothetical protein
MKFRDLIGGSGGEAAPATAAGLLAAAERARAEGAAASARLTELSAERTEALIGDDDKALDRIEAEIARALRDRDRADLAEAELRRRAGEAAAAEEQSRRDGLYERAQAAQAEGVALVTKDYVKAATALARVAGRIGALEDEVAEINRELARCGDGRRVRAIEMAARPRGGPTFEFHPHLLAELQVPDPGHMTRPFWGPDLTRSVHGRADPPPVAPERPAA